VNLRKMTEANLRDASRDYQAGDSLAKVAQRHGVHAETVRRELTRAGVRIRPRRGS
jgi:hypothetical protein